MSFPLEHTRTLRDGQGPTEFAFANTPFSEQQRAQMAGEVKTDSLPQVNSRGNHLLSRADAESLSSQLPGVDAEAKIKIRD